MARYKLRLKTLNRISAVDRPAQPTANIRLIKREDAAAQSAEINFSAEFTVAKLNDELRLVFGYAFTSTSGGDPYHDLQGDHVISDDKMIKAALEFVATGARADVMHDHLDRGGFVPFVMPLTPEIAKSFGLKGGEVGLMIGMQPDEATYAKFKSGEYTAFSIDGTGVREIVAEKIVGKRAWMTNEVNGHAHLIEDVDYEGRTVDAGATSWSESTGSEDTHSHPWIKMLDGSVVVGASEGHTHDVLATKRVAKSEQVPAVEPGPKENEIMVKTEVELQKQIDELNAKLTKSIAYGSLSDAEKAYHASLPEGERDAWLTKSRGARAEDVVKTVAADEVVYTSDDGIEFRKSDDPRLVAAAKRNDELAKEVATEKSARETVELEKRAESVMKHFTGEMKVRAAMLKAIDSIKDEEVRKAAHESLKGANDSLERMYEVAGEYSRTKSADDPEVKLEDLARKRAAEKGEAYGIAYRAVLKTPEGESLYNQIRAN